MKRYSITPYWDDLDDLLAESAGGEWVRWEDASKLMGDLVEVSAERDRLGRQRNWYMNRCDAMQEAVRNIKRTAEMTIETFELGPPPEVTS